MFLQLCAVVFDWFISDRSAAASALPRRRPALNLILLQSRDKSINLPLTHTHRHTHELHLSNVSAAVLHYIQNFKPLYISVSLPLCLPDSHTHTPKGCLSISIKSSLYLLVVTISHIHTPTHAASVVIR